MRLDQILHSAFETLANYQSKIQLSEIGAGIWYRGNSQKFEIKTSKTFYFI